MNFHAFAIRLKFIAAGAAFAAAAFPCGGTSSAQPYPEPPPRDSWKFMDDLARREPARLQWTRRAGAGELDISGGLRIEDAYGTGENLATAVAELNAFFRDAGLPENGKVPLKFARGKVAGRESYRLNAGESGVELIAEDDEGMRRGIYFLENLMASQNGAFLPYGKTERKPWLKNRISRCFFGPIKRPPFNRDELLDDIDYYPGDYLGKLAREGINGLWITVEFRDLAETSFTKRDPLAQKRLEKLRKTVERCGKYGIKIWLFSIEPASLPKDDPLLAAHPEWKGARGWRNDYAFCTSGESALRYLRESLADIFAQVPNLGGLINISHGERITNCLSALPAVSDAQVACPRCSKLPKWKIHADAARAMSEGMRESNPEAELISWLYQPQPEAERAPWVFDLARHVPEGIIIQYNFESGAFKKQLGRWRSGGDYWLSFCGPAQPFARIADAARASGAELSAKIQVGCSHEVATVPFVPAPGLLYDKYAQMKKAGCSSVMQCWYFGNYPGIMNEAAGELAFEDFNGAKEDFLVRLARPKWGANAGKAAKIWNACADGYSHYPLSNDMQYYGPVHAGIVWPLHFDIGMRPLNPTWKPDGAPNGETIGEALENHSLEEALELARTVCAEMESAEPEMEEIEKSLAPDDAGRRLDIGLMKALKIQFESARNILEFYLLRREAYFASRETGDRQKAGKLLARMAEIAREEAALSAKMAKLCTGDSRLGFHSEAESHLYSEKRLLWRIESLKAAEAQIESAREAVLRGEKLPESAFEKSAPKVRADGKWVAGKSMRWRLSKSGEGLAFEAELGGDYGYDELSVTFFDAAGTVFPQTIKFSRDGASEFCKLARTRVENPGGGVWRAEALLPDLARGGNPALRPAWIFVRRAASGSRSKARSIDYSWPECEKLPPWRLNIGPTRGDMFGRIER